MSTARNTKGSLASRATSSFNTASRAQSTNNLHNNAKPAPPVTLDPNALPSILSEEEMSSVMEQVEATLASRLEGTDLTGEEELATMLEEKTPEEDFSELDRAYEELKRLELDQLVIQKQAQQETANFEFSQNNELHKRLIQDLLMLEDDEDKFGKKAFLRKCNEFDFYVFSIQPVMNKFDQEEFVLSHHGLGDKGVIALSEALKVNQAIKRLILIDNNITPVGAEALMKALHVNKTIELLDLSDNRLGMKGCPKQFGPMLAEMLRVNSTLQHIILRGNQLGDRHVAPIVDVMAENSVLRSLDLSYNELGQKSGEYLAKMLTLNIALKKLCLEWNSLLNQGTIYLLNGLKSNNVLTHLNLAWNGVSDTGAKEIGAVLYSNNALAEFDISHNRIGKEGAKKICSGITDLSGLKSLNLSYNPLEEAGCKAIIESLQDNNTITELDLRYTMLQQPENHYHIKKSGEQKEENGHIPQGLQEALFNTMKKRRNLKKVLMSNDK